MRSLTSSLFAVVPVVALTALSLPACSGAPGADETVGASSEAVTSAADTAAILAFVNYPTTSDSLLDATVHLDSRAAANIIKARNGADGVCPSADDVPFTTLAELEALPYVKSTAVSKLQAYALAHRAPQGALVEGVSFSGWQTVAVVWGVNHSTDAELNAFLDSRAAASLVAGAPFATVAQMGPKSYVGEAALTALRTHAAAWWAAEQTPSFVLDATTLATDAEMLKESLVDDEGFVEDLMTLGGGRDEANVFLTALNAQIDALTAPLLGKTYADADAAEAAVVAAAPVENLAKSGGWTYFESIGVTPPAAMSCVAAFDVATSPDLGQLEFLSESDRPFDVVYFVGAGASAPTAASVMALVGAPAGSTSELRDVSNYYVDFEPTGAAATAVQTVITKQLEKVVYVAVFAPPGSGNTALVDVYLVGVTKCGDVVGIHSVSVET